MRCWSWGTTRAPSWVPPKSSASPRCRRCARALPDGMRPTVTSRTSPSSLLLYNKKTPHLSGVAHRHHDRPAHAKHILRPIAELEPHAPYAVGKVLSVDADGVEVERVGPHHKGDVAFDAVVLLF